MMNIRKIKKRIWLYVAIFAFICIMAVFTPYIYIQISAKAQIKSVEELSDFSADCIIVLGAKVHETTLSHMLEDRVLTGISLYKVGAAPKILMSGDHHTVSYDEVNAMREYALQKEIPPEDIFMDHAGLSTYESLYRTKNIFGAKKVVIVTQGFHLPRALYIARSLGLEAVGVSADLRTYRAAYKNDLREILACDKAVLDCLLHLSKPIGGQPIDLAGSGKVTWDK